MIRVLFGLILLWAAQAYSITIIVETNDILNVPMPVTQHSGVVGMFRTTIFMTQAGIPDNPGSVTSQWRIVNTADSVVLTNVTGLTVDAAAGRLQFSANIQDAGTYDALATIYSSAGASVIAHSLLTVTNNPVSSGGGCTPLIQVTNNTTVEMSASLPNLFNVISVGTVLGSANINITTSVVNGVVCYAVGVTNVPTGTPATNIVPYVVNASSNFIGTVTNSDGYYYIPYCATNIPFLTPATNVLLYAVSASNNFVGPCTNVGSVYYVPYCVTNGGSGGAGSGFPLTNDVSLAGWSMTEGNKITVTDDVSVLNGYGFARLQSNTNGPHILFSNSFEHVLLCPSTNAGHFAEGSTNGSQLISSAMLGDGVSFVAGMLVAAPQSTNSAYAITAGMASNAATAGVATNALALKGNTNSPIYAESDTAQSVFNRGNTVTNQADFSGATHVLVPINDMTPNAALSRQDATNMISTVVVSGAVTRLIYQSGSQTVTQIANAVDFTSGGFSGATVYTNALGSNGLMIVVKPSLSNITAASIGALATNYFVNPELRFGKRWEGSALGGFVYTFPATVDDISTDNTTNQDSYQLFGICANPTFVTNTMYGMFFPPVRSGAVQLKFRANQPQGIVILSANDGTSVITSTQVISAAFTTYITNMPVPGTSVTNFVLTLIQETTNQANQYHLGIGQ